MVLILLPSRFIRLYREYGLKGIRYDTSVIAWEVPELYTPPIRKQLHNAGIMIIYGDGGINYRVLNNGTNIFCYKCGLTALLCPSCGVLNERCSICMSTILSYQEHASSGCYYLGGLPPLPIVNLSQWDRSDIFVTRGEYSNVFVTKAAKDWLSSTVPTCPCIRPLY